MYRVAKKAIMVFEPPDNLLVQIMQKVGLAQIYEYTAVQGNENTHGGVDNSEIPNYIYRWTEKEIEKVIFSYEPRARHRFHYAYDIEEPSLAFTANNKVKHIIINIAKPAYKLLGLFFPKQKNLFAIFIEKPTLPQDLHPWLMMEKRNIKFNPKWNKVYS
jgi:hypothetical protein